MCMKTGIGQKRRQCAIQSHLYKHDQLYAINYLVRQILVQNVCILWDRNKYRVCDTPTSFQNCTEKFRAYGERHLLFRSQNRAMFIVFLIVIYYLYVLSYNLKNIHYLSHKLQNFFLNYQRLLTSGHKVFSKHLIIGIEE